MESETINSADLNYWRLIGREDRHSEFDYSGADLLRQSGIEMSLDEFQPSNIGLDTTREILKRLNTMTPQDRTVINNELTIILQKCINMQVIPLIPLKVGKSHNGHRQETDRVVKPLFPTKRKRTDSTAKNAPTLPKTKKLMKALANKTSNRAFVPAVECAEYNALPAASLSENIKRRDVGHLG